MKLSEEVRPGANRYVSGQEILQDLEAYLAPFKELAVILARNHFKFFKIFILKLFLILFFIMTAQHLLKTGKS